ncbi:MAG: CPBP family intramembrane metalloprotease [Acidobacteriaceae bacterium]|nr:CPBP family intramembrane metalloprotease [Acidobacteriaceae bacterium]
MSALFPALVVEVPFYLAAGFVATRERFAALASRFAQGGALWASALMPYLVFSLVTGTFERNAFYLLAGLCAVLSFWHAVFPRRLAYDAGFLVIAAAPVVLRVFGRIYVSPTPQLHVDLLGHLMWIRVGALALLVMREWNPGGFSFWPHPREWRVGFALYVAFLLPIIAVAIALHDVQFAPPGSNWPIALATGAVTFFGILWVVAWSEELFFRGLIERAALNSWQSPAAAVAVSALLFGSVHLWFHQFPNWRRAIVATVLGVACGIAYWRSGSVRAPMVTHALVVTTWRLFFR